MTDRFLSWNNSRNTIQRNKMFIHLRPDQPMRLIKVRTGMDHTPVLTIDDGNEVIGGGDVSVRATPAKNTIGDDDADDPDRQSFQSAAKQTAAVSATSRHSTSHDSSDFALWRLPTVLAHVPVSRSHWWAGIKAGRYPQPVRLSAKCVAWRSSDIRALVQSF